MDSDFKSMTQLARQLRKNQTKAERLLWNEVRGRKLGGFKFLRQHPIVHSFYKNHARFFIPDFYCHEKRLVVEVDGGIHEQQKEYDADREAIIRSLLLKVIRFENDRVLKEIEEVKREILAQLLTP